MRKVMLTGKTRISSVLLLTFLIGCFTRCSKSDHDSGIDRYGQGPMADGSYYVATWGNDTNSGSFEKPWGTWQKAFETAEPGDTVYFRGGVWYPTKQAYGNNITMINPAWSGQKGPIGHNGTAENPICYFNYPGESPILDCSLIEIGSFNSALDLSYVNFIHFRGLTVRNVFQPKDGHLASGIGAWTCSNMTYENMTAHDIGGRGFAEFDAFGVSPEEGGGIPVAYDTTRWINCDAYNCADMLSAVPGNGSDGFKLQNYPGSVFIIEGCRAWNCTDDGFDVGLNVIASIHNCWSFDHGFAGALDGNGFKFGGILEEPTAPATVYRRVTNCVAAFNTGSGYYDLQYIPYYRNNSRIYNNTSYHNNYGFYGSTNADLPVNLSQYRNNIAYASTDVGPTGSTANIAIYEAYPESNNTWDGLDPRPGSWPWFKETDSLTVTNDDFLSLDMNELKRPRQADGSLPDINFMKLAPGTDLIDAGTDVGLPFLGNAPDIGAFECK